MGDGPGVNVVDVEVRREVSVRGVSALGGGELAVTLLVDEVRELAAEVGAPGGLEALGVVVEGEGCHGVDRAHFDDVEAREGVAIPEVARMELPDLLRLEPDEPEGVRREDPLRQFAGGHGLDVRREDGLHRARRRARHEARDDPSRRRKGRLVRLGLAGFPRRVLPRDPIGVLGVGLDLRIEPVQFRLDRLVTRQQLGGRLLELTFELLQRALRHSRRRRR
mmetsp:Transcript_35844/g.114839  ORF Transcript_35844/g.114839 Transcript_35844/m.114839 type:complete len:222 (-) Transcript_35844:657-1322(-)